MNSVVLELPPAPGAACGPAAAANGPRRNRLLAALPAADWQQLQPLLEPVELSRGPSLVASGSLPSHVVFPCSGSVSLQSTTRAGDSIEVAMVGNEGMVGVPLVMGGGSTLWQSVVRSSGNGYSLSASSMRHELQRGAALQKTLLRYSQALMTEIAQTAVCNQHHSLEQRLCRCLLNSLDRAPTAELLMTQEEIAACLGVRRESITSAANKLQRDGVVCYARGRIVLQSRPALERRSCECYALVRREYGRLLPAAATPSAPPAPQRLSQGWLTPRLPLGHAGLSMQGGINV